MYQLITSGWRNCVFYYAIFPFLQVSFRNCFFVCVVDVIVVSVRSVEFMPISFTSIFAKRGYHLHFLCCWLILKFCFLRISTSLNTVFYILKTSVTFLKTLLLTFEGLAWAANYGNFSTDEWLKVNDRMFDCLEWWAVHSSLYHNSIVQKQAKLERNISMETITCLSKGILKE